MFRLTTGRNPTDYGELDIEFPGCSIQEAYLVCENFSSVIESAGKVVLIGPKGTSYGHDLSLAPRDNYLLYTPLDTDEIFCVDGMKTPLKISCQDVGFTKTASSANCFWPPCYTN